MPNQTFSLMHIIRTMTGSYKEDGRSDADLLSLYTETRNEAAFATLMVRHGPMVWGICKGVLGDVQDVEDACQTVFLVLANKAGKIRVTETAAGWLHQVARQTALDVRKANRSRKRLRENLKAMGGAKAIEEKPTNEEYEILQDELAKLPEKLRTALVLHYLEGRTQTEIANILGVKGPAVCERLARGKVRLQERLAKRGTVLEMAALGILLEAGYSHATIPGPLISKTVQTAAAFRQGKLTGGLAKLVQEVLKHAPAAKSWWRTNWIIALTCVGGLGVGAGGMAWKTEFLASKVRPPQVPFVQETVPPTNVQAKVPHLDAYGDPLPPHAIARIGTRRLWCRNETMLFSPQSDVLASYGGSRLPTVLWDVATGKEICRFRNPDYDIPVFFGGDLSLAFFPDGRSIVAAERLHARAGLQDSDKIHIWQTATGKLLRTDDLSKTPIGALWLVNGGSVTVLPSGEVLVIAGKRDDLLVWEATVGKKICQLEHSKKDGDNFKLSPDGRFVAAQKDIPAPPRPGPPDPLATRDTAITIWNAVTGKVMHRITAKLKRLQGVNTTLAFSADGKTLAVGHYGLWDVTSGKQVQSLSPRDAEDKKRNRLAYSEASEIIGYSRDCKTWYMLARTYTGVKAFLWDVAAHKTRSFNDSYTASGSATAAFSPNGKVMATTGPGIVGAESREVSPSGAIQLWDVATGETVGFRPRSRRLFDQLTFSDDGSMLVTVNYDHRLRFASDATCQLGWWSTRTGKEIRKPVSIGASAPAKSGSQATTPLLLSAGVKLIVRKDSEPIALYSTADGKVIRTYHPTTNRPHPISPPVLSSDGALVAAATGGGDWEGADPPSVHVWNVATGKEICRLPAHVTWPPDAHGRIMTNIWRGVFSPDNKIMALCGKSPGTVCLWDLAAQKIIRELKENDPQRVEPSMAPREFSPDGKLLATWYAEWVDVGRLSERRIETVILWEAATGRKVGQLLIPMDDGEWTSLFAFSPDGMVLAASGKPTGTNRTDIHLWDILAGREICQLHGHQDKIRSLVFSRNGRMLASASDDTTTLIWDMATLGQDPALAQAYSSAKSFTWKELEAAWQDLGNSDPSRAYRAVWVLKDALLQAVPLLQRRVQPIYYHANAKELERWIADLNSDRFAVRRKAEQALEKLGDPAVPALKHALKGKMAVDGRRRTETLLAKLEGGPARQLRDLRAVQVLEYIGTPEARNLLKHLAQGMREARLTQHAQEALDRMTKPSSVKP